MIGFGGLVSGAGGAPAAGVVLTLLDWSGRQAARTTTDGAGRYRVEVDDRGDFLMVVSAAHLEPTATVVTVRDAGRPHDIVLTGGGAVFGHVRAGTAPAPDAVVTVIDRIGAVRARTRTGADGHYEIDDLLPGSYTVSAMFGSAPPKARSITITQAARVHTDLILPSVHRFAGTVRSGDSGRPVPGAMVTLIDPDQRAVASTVTATDGGFAFEGVPAGRYSVATAYYREISRTVQVPQHGADLLIEVRPDPPNAQSARA